jgi:DNA-directed RNA polymerase specialized sigma24 family protein
MTLFYRRYKQKHIDESGLAACIFNHILNNRGVEYGLFFRNGGDLADFLCWLYPRLLNSIRNYRKEGGTFDAYIATVARYSCREYNSLNERACLAENIYSMDCVHESETREPEEAYEQELSDTPVGLSPAQMLVVMLKSYYFVTDELVSKAAPIIGIDADALGGMIDTLHRLRLKKEARAAKLASNIHRLYYRRLEHEKSIETKFEDKTVCAAISARIELIRLRMDRMRKRLKSMRLEATNKEVADVLGVPKGTVDSRMSVIKSKAATALTV